MWLRVVALAVLPPSISAVRFPNPLYQPTNFCTDIHDKIKPYVASNESENKKLPCYRCAASSSMAGQLRAKPVPCVLKMYDIKPPSEK